MTKRIGKRGKKGDPLSVQVSIKASLRRGERPNKSVLNGVYLRWVETGQLPPGWEIRGIFWRNPARHGALSDWRYSEGSLDAARVPRPIESTPRGDHEEARVTLKEYLRTIRPF